jgi:hypothetical protein
MPSLLLMLANTTIAPKERLLKTQSLLGFSGKKMVDQNELPRH